MGHQELCGYNVPLKSEGKGTNNIPNTQNLEQKKSSEGVFFTNFAS